MMAPEGSSATDSTPTSTFTPSLSPPTGVVSNPDHPQSLAFLATITASVCVSLITIFFFLRCYVRIFIKRSWIFEDYLVVIGWAGTVAFCGITRATMSHHAGEHGWDIDAEEASEASYWFSISAITYGVMIAVAKLAVLWLYRRVFSPARRSVFDISIITLIVLTIAFYTILTFLKIFECTPRERIWNKSVEGTCLQMQWILNLSGCFNTVSDYIIMLLPVHAVWKLQMERDKKALVVLAFTFGLCAPIFATIGLVVRLRNSGNADKTWKQPEILLWGAAELASGHLCVCFPELAVLFRKRLRSRGSAPRRPTASEIAVNAWDSKRSAKSQHQYLPKHLMTTTFNVNGEANYIELQDHGNTTSVTAINTPEQSRGQDTGW